MDIVFAKVIAVLVGWVFLQAGWHKLRQPKVFQAVIDNYRLLPFSAGVLFVAALGVAELSIGVGLLINGTRDIAAAAAVLFLLAYAGGMAVNLARGRRDVDCGCGSVGREQKISGHVVVRNLLLGGMAGAMFLAGPARPMEWLDWFTVLSAGASAVLIYLAAGCLLDNHRKLAELRS